MNNKDLFRALGDVDPAFIADAEKPVKKHIRIKAWEGIAACVCCALLFLAVRWFPRVEETPEATTLAREIVPPESQIEPAILPFSVDPAVPEDFSFTLIWEERAYSSDLLTPAQKETAWHLLSELPLSETQPDGPIRLTLHQNGTTQYGAGTPENQDAFFRTCQTLLGLFENYQIQ